MNNLPEKNLSLDNAEEQQRLYWWEVAFYLRRSSRYHMRRAMFYARINRVATFINLLSGTAVIGSLADIFIAGVAVVGALLVTSVSALDLVIDTQPMAQSHLELRKRLLEIEARLPGNSVLTHEEYSKFKSDCLKVEMDEPPVYYALDRLAHNDAVRASYPRSDTLQHFENVTLIERLTANWLMWSNRD